MTGEQRRITLIGAGLAGSLMAIHLARAGFRVDLFERGTDPRVTPPASGRSINLALAERGRRALAEVGLLDAVDRFALPMSGRQMHHLDRDDEFQPYGVDDEDVIYSVHRAKLNNCLLEAARGEPGIRCFFAHRLRGLDLDARRLRFEDPQTGAEHRHEFHYLIAADGAGSSVRRSLEAAGHVAVTEALLDHGYKEFHLPPGDDGGFRLNPEALHIWPRGQHMLIALPNPDASFTLTLFLDNDHPGGNPPGFEQLQTDGQRLRFMQQNFPDIVPELPDLLAQFDNHPVGILGTVYAQPWTVDGRVLMIGDAAHAIVPFHGQGMNAAFEDCTLLNELLQAEDDIGQAFRRFSETRKADADAIAEMALENYQIMRDAVSRPGFLLRKQLEHELERRHPDRFAGRYSLVMFHHLPYEQALRRGEIQSGILDQLLDDDAASLEAVDFRAAEDLVRQRLEPLPGC